jgi:hypothetical protein
MWAVDICPGPAPFSHYTFSIFRVLVRLQCCIPQYLRTARPTSTDGNVRSGAISQSSRCSSISLHAIFAHYSSVFFIAVTFPLSLLFFLFLTVGLRSIVLLSQMIMSPMKRYVGRAQCAPLPLIRCLFCSDGDVEWSDGRPLPTSSRLQRVRHTAALALPAWRESCIKLWCMVVVSSPCGGSALSSGPCELEPWRGGMLLSLSTHAISPSQLSRSNTTETRENFVLC